jgi:RNA polymerase-binding transcription factor DksA
MGDWDEERGQSSGPAIERETELRADIERELRKYDKEQYGTLADSIGDPGERSVADLPSDVDLAEIDADVKQWREIEAALLRVAQGTYRLCADCGERIESARLQVSPHVARCLACQERAERAPVAQTVLPSRELRGRRA